VVWGASAPLFYDAKNGSPYLSLWSTISLDFSLVDLGLGGDEKINRRGKYMLRF
jgi:hypothetical protein